MWRWRLGAAALLWAGLASAGLAWAGEVPVPGLGAFKLGMTYDEIRAQAPGVVWADDETRGIRGAKALTFGGETFDVLYALEPWDRVKLKASLADNDAADGACERRFAALATQVEAAFGELEAAPEIDSDRSIFESRKDTMRVGKDSKARVLRDRAGERTVFQADAQWRRGTTNLYLHGDDFDAKSENPPACRLSLSLYLAAPRPPQGVVAYEDLIVRTRPSLAVMHHSLDGLPAPPPEGVAVKVDCVIQVSYRGSQPALSSCSPAKDNDQTALIYASAAITRASEMAVEEKSQSGRWVTGERTTVPVRIGPEDRREGLAVLPIGQKPKPVKFRTSPARMDLHSYYPPQALNREAEADIVVGCVVQADLSVICPEVTTTTTAEDLKSAFAAAASKIVTLYRVEPLLADGKSAVGASFRSRIKFRIG